MIRIAAEEAWAPKEILDRYRRLLQDKPEAWDPGFRSLWGFFLGNTERATSLARPLRTLGEERLADRAYDVGAGQHDVETAVRGQGRLGRGRMVGADQGPLQQVAAR